MRRRHHRHQPQAEQQQQQQPMDSEQPAALEGGDVQVVNDTGAYDCLTWLPPHSQRSHASQLLRKAVLSNMHHTCPVRQECLPALSSQGGHLSTLCRWGTTTGLCTGFSGFYLLCYALILSKCPYYAQSLHPLCSNALCSKAKLRHALLSAELESLLWDRLSLLRGKCAFPWGGFVASLRYRVRSDFVGARSLSISDTTSLLPASLLPPSSPAGLSFAACRDPATLEPSAILDRAAAHCAQHVSAACMNGARCMRMAPHIIILPAKRLLCRHCALSPQGPIMLNLMPEFHRRMTIQRQAILELKVYCHTASIYFNLHGCI